MPLLVNGPRHNYGRLLAACDEGNARPTGSHRQSLVRDGALLSNRMNELAHSSAFGGSLRGIQDNPKDPHRNLSPRNPTMGLIVDVDLNDHSAIGTPVKSPTDSFLGESPLYVSPIHHRRPGSGFSRKGLGGAHFPWPSRPMILIAQFAGMYILAYTTIYMTSSIPQENLLTGSVHRVSIGRNASHSPCLLQPPTCRLDAEAVMDAAGTGESHTLKGQQVNVSALPLVFFFAGVEGSGHKFFEQVFRNLPVNFSGAHGCLCFSVAVNPDNFANV